MGGNVGGREEERKGGKRRREGGADLGYAQDMSTRQAPDAEAHGARRTCQMGKRQPTANPSLHTQSCAPVLATTAVGISWLKGQRAQAASPLAFAKPRLPHGRHLAPSTQRKPGSVEWVWERRHLK